MHAPWMWIDSHCHLDAPEFGAEHALAVQARTRAAQRGVGLCVIPAVERANFDTVRQLAHRTGDAYALGIHPLCVPQATDDDLAALDAALSHHRDDPRLVAVGEIGLDGFVPEWQNPEAQAAQVQGYEGQLAVAARRGWPVILHVRRSADPLLKALRALRARGMPVPGGIAHAFNGSPQQAEAFIEQGFKLGFGGAMTHERALQIRRLAASVPAEALVLETDAPDIPPQWLYRTAHDRAQGHHSRNEPSELPRIALTLADLRGWSLEETARITTANALNALPRLKALIDRAADRGA